MSGTLPTEDSRALAGVPDGFDRLWTPYRMAYINGDHKPADSSSEECPVWALGVFQQLLLPRGLVSACSFSFVSGW